MRTVGTATVVLLAGLPAVLGTWGHHGGDERYGKDDDNDYVGELTICFTYSNTKRHHVIAPQKIKTL